MDTPKPRPLRRIGKTADDKLTGFKARKRERLDIVDDRTPEQKRADGDDIPRDRAGNPVPVPSILCPDCHQPAADHPCPPPLAFQAGTPVTAYVTPNIIMARLHNHVPTVHGGGEWLQGRVEITGLCMVRFADGSVAFCREEGKNMRRDDTREDCSHAAQG